MAKPIEMNIKEDSGYEILYPQTQSNIVLNSIEINELFSLSTNSVIDDAFKYIDRKMILIQHGIAGVNVTLKTQGGNPLEGFQINGIFQNYDGTGTCITDEEGKCFGYCNAGNINISCNNYVDIKINNQQINAVASEFYNVELIGSNLNNFLRYTSSTSNIVFSPNVQRVDVSIGGGGSSGSGGGTQGGDGGGGGYSVIQNNFNFDNTTKQSAIVGSGGTSGAHVPGGNSSFGGVIANGAQGQSGNGRGGDGVGYGNGGNGGNGSTYIVTSFTEQSLYGGGGGAGSYSYSYSVGTGGSPGGGDGGRNEGNPGKDNWGGGGGGNGRDYYDSYASGGSGCVAIRMHLKSAS